ncbi:hypothetical protein [Bosea sp. NBC_00550]|nr:hypothetical protein [Bosea sp. NBC_00550]UZF93304.1 hypothetical protein NWE53_03585 [Bosea sp. NBC_00550]
MGIVAIVFLACLASLCELLLVTADGITKDRRGNMPPPSGGIGAF